MFTTFLVVCQIAVVVVNGKKVIPRKFALQIKNYLMCQLCIMNGLHASNLIEFRLKDVENCSTNT